MQVCLQSTVKAIFSIMALILFSFSASAFYDHASNVMYDGVPVQDGGLRIRVYDSPTGGNLQCEFEQSSGVIYDGMWSVYVDCDDDLEYGETYYKQYEIKQTDLSGWHHIMFDGDARLGFISRQGDVSADHIDTSGLDDVYVERSGDTMSGDLTVEGEIWLEDYVVLSRAPDDISDSDVLVIEGSGMKTINIEDGDLRFWGDGANEILSLDAETGEVVVHDDLDVQGSITGSDWASLDISRSDVSSSDVGLGDVENIALSSAGWNDIGIATSDVSAGDVGLGDVENIAVSSIGGSGLSWDSGNNRLDVDNPFVLAVIIVT